MYPQRANIPLRGLERCVLTVGAMYQVPTTKLEPSIGTIHQSWIYMVGKMHSGKVDQLILASGGSEHA